MTTTTAQDEWTQWHSTREHDLAAPHDWLSVSAFLWITEPDQQFDGVPGRWSARDGVLTVHFDPESGEPPAHLLDGAAPITTAASGSSDVTLPESGSARFALIGDNPTADVLIEVIRRAGFYALRLRDPSAATRTGFTGVPIFDYDPAWVRPARLELFAEPQQREIGTAAPGLAQVARIIGTVHVQIGENSYPLAAGGTPQEPRISFTDETSGDSTAAWRAVPVRIDDDGQASIDFNRAINFPFVFTDFGTCPRPVAENHLPLAVTAGEKAPHGRTGVPPTSGGPTAVPGT